METITITYPRLPKMGYVVVVRGRWHFNYKKSTGMQEGII